MKHASPGAEIVWLPGARHAGQAAAPPGFWRRANTVRWAWTYPANFVAAAGILVALLPLMLLIAASLRAVGSAVLQRRRVVGRLGIEFDLLLFADPLIAADAKGGWRQRVARPLGGLLNAPGLRAMPQLLNVLQGSMVVAGPRPAAWHELEGDRGAWQAVDAYLFSRPGLFGSDYRDLPTRRRPLLRGRLPDALPHRVGRRLGVRPGAAPWFAVRLAAIALSKLGWTGRTSLSARPVVDHGGANRAGTAP